VENKFLLPCAQLEQAMVKQLKQQNFEEALDAANAGG